ncbi:MAG: hypothetical protein ACLFS0_04830, partial [Bacteroidales bacterium]
IGIIHRQLTAHRSYGRIITYRIGINVRINYIISANYPFFVITDLASLLQGAQAGAWKYSGTRTAMP